MQIRFIAFSTAIAFACAGLSGCGSTWVDADNSGCSDADIAEITKGGPHGTAEMMGTGICKAHGMDRYAGKWRCKGEITQVACR